MKPYKTLIVVLTGIFVALTSARIDKVIEKAKPIDLYHVLLFKWKPDVSKARVLELEELWSGLTVEVKGFDSFEMKPLVHGDFDYVVMLEFSSTEAHSTYLGHEDHQKIADLGAEIVENFLSYSYWR